MFRALLNTLFPSAMKRCGVRKRMTRVNLRLETLEERFVPATLQVGYQRNEYHSINAAIANAHNGDTIKVDSGFVDQEQVVIDKNITLLGSGNGKGNNSMPVIQAPPTSLTNSTPLLTGHQAIVEVLPNVSAKIQGFTIDGNAASPGNVKYGILLDNNAYADIENNHITGIVDVVDAAPGGSTYGVAIDVGNSAAHSRDPNLPDASASAKIQNNTIDNYQRAGIVVSNTNSSAAITNNSISGNSVYQDPSQTGVEVSFGATADIENNTITGNQNGYAGTGIALYSPGVLRLPDYDTDPNDFATVTVKNNTLSGNDYGVFGSKVTPALCYQPGSADVENNKVSGNTYVGIEFDNSSGVVISNNQLSGNGSGNAGDGGIYLYQSNGNLVANNQSKYNTGSGIYLEGSSWNFLSNNQSTNNTGFGIVVDANSTANLLTNNQFKGNTIYDAVDLSGPSCGTAGTANWWYNNQGNTALPPGILNKGHAPKWFTPY